MKIARTEPKRKIPKDAKKVFDGILFDVYQWQQKMYDGTLKTFESLKRKSDTVNVYPVTNEGKIVLTSQSQPGMGVFTGCLGGRMNLNEDPLTAAKRELLEESGYKAREWKLWFTVQPAEKMDWAVYTFIARDLEKVDVPRPGNGEKITLVKYSFDRFLKLVAKEEYRDKEVSLKVFEIYNNPGEIERLRKLFLE